MSPKAQKISLIVTIVLLLVFGVLSGYSIYLKAEKEKRDNYVENPNKLEFLNGKLWFYDDKGKLLGTYECENLICGVGEYATTTEEHSLNSLQVSEAKKIPIINNKFVFIRDNKSVEEKNMFIYDLENKRAYKEMIYTSVNDYGVGLEGGMYIVKDKNNKYGVIQISSVVKPVISTSYEFIGLINDTTKEGKVRTNSFVAMKNGSWLLLDSKETILGEKIQEPIVTYSSRYVVTDAQNGSYRVYNYNGSRKHESDFKKLWFTEDYLNCVTHDNQFYVYNISSQRVVSDVYNVSDTDVIKTVLDNKRTMSIYINDKRINSFSLY